MSYVEIQKEESAPSRVQEGHSRNQYGESAVARVKMMLPFMYGRILNVGCGDGLETEAIIGGGFNVIGIDISDDKIDIAKEHGLEAIVGRMEKLPFDDDSFDTVYCSHTLEHAEDLEKAISELERVSSRLVLIVPIETRGTANPAHTSPIINPEDFKDKFSGRILYERFIKPTDELVLVINNVKYKSESRGS